MKPSLPPLKLEKTREPGPRPRAEPWTYAAFAIGAATAALYLYLGIRPGGTGPIVAYTVGPPALFVSSAMLLLFGLAWSAWRRPVLQRGRTAALLCLGASALVASFPLAYPSSFEGRPSPTHFRLPFDGEWVVRWGGGGARENPLVFQPDRRFGYDFVRCDEAGRSADAAKGFLCRGEPVLAPAPGEVVALHDEVVDAARSGPPPPQAGKLGNYLVLRVAESEYLFLSGLEHGSIAPAVGELVEAGAVLARVGFSARSPATPEPHLGVHLQDTPVPGRGEGIPIQFRGYVAEGRAVDIGEPQGAFALGRHEGERVRNAGRCPK